MDEPAVLHSPNVRKHYKSCSVYTDISPATPEIGRHYTVHPRTAYPVIKPLPGFGYRRGPAVYTEEDFQEIIRLGIKVKCLEARRKRRRQLIENLRKRYEEQIKDLNDDEEMDIHVLMDDLPLVHLPFESVQLNNDSLI